MNIRSLMAAAAVLAAAPAAFAQSTAYYILDGDSNQAFIVQDGAVQSTFTLDYTDGYPQYPIRILGDDVLTANRSGSTAIGRTLDGTPTGTTYTHAQALDQLLDGATDGVNTYAARCCSGADGIYVGDLQFGNLQALVLTGGQGVSGVAYSSATGTLFATVGFGNVLNQYSTSGDLLSSVAIDGTFSLSSLAYESSTQTLWAARNGSNTIYNIGLDGSLLQTIAVTGGLTGNFYGGEMSMAPVPEPTTTLLLALGLAGVGLARRHRRAD